MSSRNGSIMTNNPICFVCGATGAGCFISTKPQKRGAYFSFLATHSPPDGANMPDSDGFVSACVVCKACLTEQWNSYERHKTPLVERIFWMKRIDDQAFTGAEISIQGEFVAQYIGTNSNGLSIDEKLDHGSHDPNKLRRKPTGASLSGTVFDPEETSSSCDDASRVLDLSTSPRKNSPNKSSAQSTQAFKTLPNAKSRPVASERKLRTRHNSVQNASTFVCYTCRGLFSSPQKSRFLSCTYTSDDEPYFPFVQKLTRPDGAKEITKSGLAEVCCDCRKTLSRQWRVFETRKVPVEKRVYDIESLVYSSQLGSNIHKNNNNNDDTNKNQNFLGNLKNSFPKSEMSPEELPRCFACSQSSNSLENISDLFLRGKSENVIGLLPLSKKLLERKSSSISQHMCCKKCSEILFLESRVLEESVETASKVSIRPQNVASERKSRNRAEEELPALAEEARGRFPHLASDFSPSSSDSSRDCVSPSKRKEALSSATTPSPFRTCFVCRHDLDDGEISTASQKASVILHLANLMPSSLEDVKFSSELRICGKCSGYLLPSLLKDLKHLPLRKEFLNGGYDSSKCLVCFYCSSKEEATEPGFVSVKIREDMKSTKIKNLSLLGVREIVVCRRCHDKQNKSTSLKRKLSENPNEGNSKIRKVDHSDDTKEPLHPSGHVPYEEKESSTTEAAASVGCLFQRENATGHERTVAKVESNGDDDDDDDDDVKEVQRNQDLNQRILTCQNKNNGTTNTHTSKRHRPIKTSSGSSHPPVSIFASAFNSSSSAASSVFFHRQPPASSPGFASTYPPYVPANYLDSYYLVHCRAMNQLLAGRNQDGDTRMKNSTSKQTIKRNGNFPEDTSCWTGQNFHEIACEAIRSDNFTSKSSFYRPFSDDESLPKGFGGGTNRRGSPRLSDLRFSREEQELEASPSPPESVSVSSDFPPPSDERLTAALGLISLCRSKFPGEKLPNGECDPGVVLSTREDEGCGTADRKNIPQLEMRTSEHLLREANAEASGSKAAALKGVSNEQPLVPTDRPMPRVIHWPGVNAIVESYNNYFMG